jgi:hypothetical protein
MSLASRAALLFFYLFLLLGCASAPIEQMCK